MVVGDDIGHVREEPSPPYELQREQLLFSTESEDSAEPPTFEVCVASYHCATGQEAEHSGPR